MLAGNGDGEKENSQSEASVDQSERSEPRTREELISYDEALDIAGMTSRTRRV